MEAKSIDYCHIELLLEKGTKLKREYLYGEARVTELASVNGLEGIPAAYVIILKANRDNWFLLYEGDEVTEETFRKLGADLSMLLDIDIEITVDLLNVFLQPEPDKGLVERMMVQVSKVWYLYLKRLSDVSVGCDMPDGIEVEEGYQIILKAIKDAENEKFWEEAFCDPLKNASKNATQFLSVEQVESIAAKLLKIDDIYSSGIPISFLLEAVEQESMSFVLQLLLLGFNPNHFLQSDGITALHVAAKNNNKAIVKLLLAFKADPKIKNKKGEMPIDLAADKEISQLLKETADGQAKTSTCFASNPNLLEGTRTGTYLMSLDGGGIRVFNSITFLIALEERMKELSPKCRPIHNYFDYIAGTSSGAIAALTLLYTNHSLRIGRCLVYQILIKVFTLRCIEERKNSMESNLQSIFKGKVMSSLKGPPHAIVTTTKHPGKLSLITSYDESEFGSNQQVWEAARMSSAAPFIFPPVNDIYLDGGLVANNPTNVALKEISSKIKQNCKFDCVLSIGTGSFEDPKLVDHLEYFRGTFPIDRLHDPVGLIKSSIILMQNKEKESSEESAKPLCKTEGWNYHRWSPPLSRNLGSICTDLNVIIDMMYNTEMYILQNPGTIDNIAKCILERKTRPN